MKHNIFKFTVVILMSAALNISNAIVKDINKISDINLDQIDQKVMVVFDLDNTLIETKQTLGSDQWFRGYWARLASLGYNVDQIKDELIPVYNAAMNVTQVNTVEDNTLDVFNKIKGTHAYVIGLTSRNHELISTTKRQLSSVGLKFDKHQKEHIFSVNENVVFYQDGIIFANGQDKSKCLDHYMKAKEIKPNRIIFVDDHHAHVKKMESYAKTNQIDYIGYRYGHLDSKVESLKMNIADYQQANLKIISDDIAYKEVYDISEDVM